MLVEANNVKEHTLEFNVPSARYTNPRMVHDIHGDDKVSGTITADRSFCCLHLPSCHGSRGSDNSLKPGRQSDAYLAIHNLDVATEHGADDTVDERVDDCI